MAVVRNLLIVSKSVILTNSRNGCRASAFLGNVLAVGAVTGSVFSVGSVVIAGGVGVSPKLAVFACFGCCFEVFFAIVPICACFIPVFLYPKFRAYISYILISSTKYTRKYQVDSFRA